MDQFKLKPGAGKKYEISEQTFIDATKKRAPYCIRHNTGESYYAVCPECDNPIQIVGLYKRTIEAGRKPYGRHNKGSIPQLAEYCEEDYMNCSYSNPEWKQPDHKRSSNSLVARRTLQLMKSQFDRVVNVFSEDTDIYISSDFAKELLKGYMLNKGWLYHTATINNLPWLLGLANRSHTLFGRRIVNGSGLHKALAENCEHVRFEGTGKYVKVMNREGEFLNLNFFLYDPVQDVVGEHLTETIKFQVSEGNPPNAKKIYEKTIHIDTDYFLALVNLPENENRNEKYLVIADDLINI